MKGKGVCVCLSVRACMWYLTFCIFTGSSWLLCAVAATVASRSHAIRRRTVDVQLLSTVQTTSYTVKVEGIPSAVGKTELEMYFESKKWSGGGEIADLQYDTGKGTATVAYASHFGKSGVEEVDGQNSLGGRRFLFLFHLDRLLGQLLLETSSLQCWSCFKDFL